MLFFTLPKSTDAPVVTGGGLFSWGTKFKYSGRTEKEILEDVESVAREEPTVNRLGSLRRKASSVPATPSTPVGSDLGEISKSIFLSGILSSKKTIKQISEKGNRGYFAKQLYKKLTGVFFFCFFSGYSSLPRSNHSVPDSRLDGNHSLLLGPDGSENPLTLLETVSEDQEQAGRTRLQGRSTSVLLKQMHTVANLNFGGSVLSPVNLFKKAVEVKAAVEIFSTL